MRCYQALSFAHFWPATRLLGLLFSINRLVGVDKAVADATVAVVGNLEGQVAEVQLEKGSQLVQRVLDWDSRLEPQPVVVDSHRMLLLLEVVVQREELGAVGQTTELASHR